MFHRVRSKQEVWNYPVDKFDCHQHRDQTLLGFPFPESEAEHEVPTSSLKACYGQGIAGPKMQDGEANSKQVSIFCLGQLFCVPVKFVSLEATIAATHSEHSIMLVLVMMTYN